jgi:hypothetical protein
MNRVPAIAVLLAAAAFLPKLEAQMRAMQRPGVTTRISVGSGFRAVQVPPARFGVMSPRPIGRRASSVGPVAFRHNVRFRTVFGNSCFTGRFVDPFFCRQFFFRNRFLFAQPVFLPYPASTAPYSQAAEQNSSPVAYEEDDLSRQVERLTDEVERLREEQAAREQPRQPTLRPESSSEDKAATFIVVFRDGRRSEIKNFAIIGPTLWVFSAQQARKILISDLDVEATKEVNADRGIDFRVTSNP